MFIGRSCVVEGYGGAVGTPPQSALTGDIEAPVD